MKKRWIITALIIFLGGSAWGADYTWTGAAHDGLWNTPGNWMNTTIGGVSGYPGSGPTDTATLDGTGDYSLPAEIPSSLSEVKLESLTMDGGSLNVQCSLTPNNLSILSPSIISGNSYITLGGILDLEANADWSGFVSTLTGNVTGVIVRNDVFLDLGVDNIELRMNGNMYSKLRIIAPKTITITNESNAISVGTIDAPGYTVILSATAASGSISQTGEIVADRLEASASGAIMLNNTANAVKTLLVTDAGGSVAVQLTNNAPLEITGITAGADDVTINVLSGGITQTGAIIANSLKTTTVGADTTLDNPLNAIGAGGFTASTGGGSLSFRNSVDLIVGGSILTGGGSVTLLSSGNIVGGNVSAGGGSVIFSSSGDITMRNIITGVGIGAGDITLNAGGNIISDNGILNGQVLTFNAGYPSQAVNGTPGTITIMTLQATCTNLVIYGHEAIIAGGTHILNGNLNVWTDDTSATDFAVTNFFGAFGKTANAGGDTWASRAGSTTYRWIGIGSSDWYGNDSNWDQDLPYAGTPSGPLTSEDTLIIDKQGGAANNPTVPLGALMAVNTLEIRSGILLLMNNLAAETVTIQSDGVLYQNFCEISGTDVFTNAGNLFMQGNIGANAVNNSGNIQVIGAGNFFIGDTFSQTGGNISAATSGVTLNIYASGAISQSGGIISNLQLDVGSTGGAITLTGSNAVPYLQVTGSGGAVQFVNNVPLVIYGITAGDNNVSITTYGAGADITQSGVITTTKTLTLNSGGLITLTSTGNSVGTLSVLGAGGDIQYTNSGALVLSNITAGTNNVNIVTTGTASDITQSAPVTTTGTLTLNSEGLIRLTTSGNSVTALNVRGASGPVQFTNYTALEIAGVNNVGSNSVSITIPVFSPPLTQTGPIVTGGGLYISTYGSITLDNSGNSVNSIQITDSRGAVQFTNNTSLTIRNVNNSISNLVSITATGSGADIQNIADITVTGGTLILNAGGSIILNNNVTADSVTLNAGYPNQTVYNTPGNVTVAGISISATDLVIYGQGVISTGGAKTFSGNLKVWTDDTAAPAAFFTDFGGKIANTGGDTWVSRAGSTLYRWTGGGNNVWYGNDSNWDQDVPYAGTPGGPLTSVNTLIIDGGGNNDPVVPSGALTVLNTLEVRSGALTLQDALTAGTVTIQSGGVLYQNTNAINGVNSFTNNGTLNIGGSVSANAVNNSGNIHVTGTGNFSCGTFSQTGGNIDPQTVGDVLYISASGAISQSAGTITGLRLNAGSTGGAITMNGMNTVLSLQVSVAGGAVSFVNYAPLEIVTVNNVGSNNVSITVNGSGGNLTQTGPIVTDGTLYLNTYDFINLTNSGNSVNALVIDTFGAVQFTNNGALGIAGVNSISSSNVIITASGSTADITQTGGTISIPGGITLNAGRDITLTNVSVGSVNLNAGYPNQAVYNTAGNVTVGGLSAASGLTVWGKTVSSTGGNSLGGGNLRVWTDDTLPTAFFTAFGKTANVGLGDIWVNRGSAGGNTYTWVGSAGGYGGDNTSWGDPLNWEISSPLGPTSAYPGQNAPDDKAILGAVTVVIPPPVPGFSLDSLSLDGTQITNYSTIAIVSELKIAGASAAVTDVSPGQMNMGGGVLTIAPASITIDGGGANLNPGRIDAPLYDVHLNSNGCSNITQTGEFIANSLSIGTYANTLVMLDNPLNSIGAGGLGTSYDAGQLIFYNSGDLVVSGLGIHVDDVTLTSGGSITSVFITANNITLNAAENIIINNNGYHYISDGTITLNAGYPNQTVYGTPGSVTITDMPIDGTANVVIYGHEVISNPGTKTVDGNLKVWTDDTVAPAAFFTAFDKTANDGSGDTWASRGVSVSGTYRWTGNATSDWYGNDGNWDQTSPYAGTPGGPLTSEDTLVIDGGGHNDPVVPSGALTVVSTLEARSGSLTLQDALTVETVTIQSGATLDLHGNDIGYPSSVTQLSLSNNGTLVSAGAETLSGITSLGGLVILDGEFPVSAGATAIAGYNNLTVRGNNTNATSPAVLTVANTLTVATPRVLNLSGTVTAPVVNISGNITVTGAGIINCGTFVQIDGVIGAGAGVNTLTINASGAINQSAGYITGLSLIAGCDFGPITMNGPNRALSLKVTKANGPVLFTETSPAGFIVDGINASDGVSFYPVTLICNNGGAGTPPVTQNSGSAAAINCSNLTLSGPASFTLENQNNHITTLMTTGPVNPALVSYRDMSDFVTGAIDTTDTSDPASGAVTLQAGGNVTQQAGTQIITNSLTLMGDGNSFLLENAGNHVTAIRTLALGAAYPGVVSYTDSGAFTIGTTGTDRLQSSDSITLQAGGNVGQVAGTQIITTDLTLKGNGNVYTLNNSGNTAVNLATADAGTNQYPGTISYVNAGALNIGVDTNGLWSTAAGSITLNTAGNITQTEIIRTGTLSLTSTGNITLGNDTPGNMVSAVQASTGAGFNFANSAALTINVINGGTGAIKIVNCMPITVSGNLTSAGTVTIQTNNFIPPLAPGIIADNNLITFDSSINITTSKLFVISGTPPLVDPPASDDDPCGFVEISAVAVVYVSGPVDVEARKINNSGSFTSAGGINLYLDDSEHQDVGNMTSTTGPLNFAPRPEHGGGAGDINLVYYSGTLTSAETAHFAAPFVMIAVPTSATPDLNFTGFSNVYIVNAVDSFNRNVNISTSGFIEFYNPSAPGANAYTYTGTNSYHLNLSAASGIQSYSEAAGGTTTVDMGNSNFTVTGGISILRGNLSISSANNVSLSTVAGTAGNTNTLSLIANTVTVSGTLGTGTVRLGDLHIMPVLSATFYGNIYAASYGQSGGSAFFGTTTTAITQNYTGSFVNTGATNTTTIHGSIVTGSVIAIDNYLTLSGDVTLDSSAGNGDISLPVVASTVGNLAISNGDGSVNLNGPVSLNGSLTQTGAGPVNIFGNISTTNANISIGGALVVQVDSLLIDSGTGAGDISFNTIDNSSFGPAYNLEVSAGTGSIIFGGNAGTANPLGNLTLENSSPGAVQVNAEIYTASLVFNGGPAQRIQQNSDDPRLGDVLIRDGTTLTLTGNVRQRNGGTLTIGEGVSGILDTGFVVSPPNGYSWFGGGSVGTVPVAGAAPFTAGFAGFTGTVVFSKGSLLITRDLNTADSGFDIKVGSLPMAAEPSAIVIQGSGYIGHTFSGNLTNSTIILRDGGKLRVDQDTINPADRNFDTFKTNAVCNALVDIGNLEIQGGGNSVDSDLIVRGKVTIDHGGDFTTTGGASNFYYPYIRVEGWQHYTGASPELIAWLNNNGTAPANYDSVYPGFSPGYSLVEFGDQTKNSGKYGIYGNTDWSVLRCKENSATMLFSNYEDPGDPEVPAYDVAAHIHRIKQWLDVVPTGGTPSLSIPPSYPPTNMITLDVMKNLIAPGGPYPGTPVSAPPAVPNEFFWHFYLAPGAEVDLNYVEILHSYAQVKIPVPQGLTSMGTGWEVYAWTYVCLDTGTGDPDPDNISPPSDFEKTRWNVNWFVMNNFMYSYAEDSNHNGKIDRIRIQSTFDVIDGNDGAFSDFEIGDIYDQYGNRYSVDTSKGYNGYRRVQTDILSAPHPNDLDSIYVYIKEDDERHPYTDGGVSLHWKVLRNTSLKDLLSRTTVVGNGPENGPADEGWTTDTVPPRINYALAVPGLDELYIQMSKQVNPVSLTLGFSNPMWNGTLQPLSAGTSSSEFLIKNFDKGGPPTVQDLVKGTSGDTFNLSYIQDVYRRGPQDPYHYYEGRVGHGITINADQSGRALDKSDPNFSTEKYYFLYPIPKYPRTYDYDNGGGGYDANGFLNNSANIQPYVPVVGPDCLQPGTSVPADAKYPPNKAAFPPSPGDPALEHRFTDLLVSPPPFRDNTVNNLTDYYIWPLWARYDDSVTPVPADVGSYYNDPQYSDIITDFSGKRFLEFQDIVLQARINDDAAKGMPSGVFGGLVYSTGGYKAVKVNGYGYGNGPEGLWIPVYPLPPSPPAYPYTGDDPYFTNMVPWRSPVVLKLPDAPPRPVPSAPLFNFTFTTTDPYFAVGTELGFFFRLNSAAPVNIGGSIITLDDDLFAGRLDVSAGTKASDLEDTAWYRKVRPFSFGVHDVTRQRSGVTILNNVINSDKRERVFLDYKLIKSGQVTIQVFTLDGNLVKVLKREHQSAASTYYRVFWDGTNQGGRPVARGMYFIRIVAPEIDEIRKVMVVK